MPSLDQHSNTETAQVRVIVGLDLTLSRQALAGAMTSLRPGWKVREVLPEDLDQAIQCEPADVVICSELSDAIETSAPMWFLLHPYGSPRCVVTIRGIRQEAPNMPLTAILEYIDTAFGYVKLR